MESLYVSLLQKKIVFSGLIKGPFIPMYGFGAMFILNACEYVESYFEIFVISLTICTLFEYLTHYFLEKDFNIRKWNYSNFKYNCNGRVCLFYSICWGFLGILLIDCIHPLLLYVICDIPNIYFEIFNFICFVYITIQFYKLKKLESN